MKKINEYKINDDGNCKNCSACVSLSSVRLETFCLPFKITTHNYQQCQECKDYIDAITIDCKDCKDRGFGLFIGGCIDDHTKECPKNI